VVAPVTTTRADRVNELAVAWLRRSYGTRAQVLEMQTTATPTAIRAVQPISKLRLWAAEVHYLKTMVTRVPTDAINEIAGRRIITNANIGTFLCRGNPWIKAALDAHKLVTDNQANVQVNNLLTSGSEYGMNTYAGVLGEMLNHT
jgi:hypothetical protein